MCLPAPAAWALLLIVQPMVVQTSGTSVVNVPGVGRILVNDKQGGLKEALGVPYAQAPVGNNRFRPPKVWSPSALTTGSLINATKYGSVCPQVVRPADGSDMHQQSEDCLTLNIWAPARRKSTELLPVFFWIHGGGFMYGSGRLYNGTFLARQDLVVVTINYRLGALGWLPSKEISEENPSSPGNGAVHGFLDQLEALRWVHAHIGEFGGDSSQITIGGESAGSLSTCVHLHMPSSKGLFRRAILESGSCVAYSPWGAWNATDTKASTALLFRDSNSTNLSELRRVSVSKLLELPEFEAIGPGVDGWFLKAHPSDLPVWGTGIDVIVGSNTMDTLYAPPYSIGGAGPTDAKSYASLIDAYFGAEGLDLYPAPVSGSSEEVEKAFFRVSSDVCNTCPKHWAAQKFLEAGDTVYAYEFGFYSKVPYRNFACHGCEIPSVFNDSAFVHTKNGTTTSFMVPSYNARLGDTISRHWAQFVKTGRPSPSWPKYVGGVSSADFLNVSTGEDGQPVITVDHGSAHRCEFFERFVKKSSKHWRAFLDFCVAPDLSPSRFVQKPVSVLI